VRQRCVYIYIHFFFLWIFSFFVVLWNNFTRVCCFSINPFSFPGFSYEKYYRYFFGNPVVYLFRWRCVKFIEKSFITRDDIFLILLNARVHGRITCTRGTYLHLFSELFMYSKKIWHVPSEHLNKDRRLQ